MRKTIVLLLFAIGYNAAGQSPLEVKVDGLFVGSLEHVLTSLSRDYGVQFSFDKERAANSRVRAQALKQPLKQLLDNICKDVKLKYYVGNGGVIVLIERWESPRQTTVTSRLERTYFGSPTKRNFTITGKVIDKVSKETLPFVNVTILNKPIGATTNVDGLFTLTNVPSDTSTLALSYLGYSKQVVYLTPSTPVSDLLFELEAASQSIEEVTITGERQGLVQANEKPSAIKFTPLKLNTLPALGEKDIFRSFQLMPGISAANENSSGLYVRGGTPDQSLVLYDGFTVYNVEHLFGFFSAFNSNAIKDVQLYKGGFEPRFGGRLSSVVEITGKEGNRKEFNAAVDVGLMAINGFVEFPIKGKTSAILSLRRSWKSPLYETIFDKYSGQADKEEPMMRFGREMNNDVTSYFYDINAKVTHRPNDFDIFSLSIYSGADELDNSINPSFGGGFPGGGGGHLSMESVDLTQWGNTGASLKWSREWSKKLYTNSLISFSQYYSKRDRTTGGMFTDSSGNVQSIKRGLIEDNNLFDFSVKADAEYKITNDNKVEIGVQATQNEISYTYSQNDTLTVIDRQSNGLTLASYVQDKLNLIDGKLNLTGGLRFTYFSPTSKLYYEPRLNSTYTLNKNFRFKASVGRYYQFAKRVVREDILQGSRDFWALADNDKLPVSQSNQLMAGVAFETRSWLIDVEAYYKQQDKLSEYSLRFSNDPRNLSYDEFFYAGKGYAKGIDVLIQKKLGDFTGWVGYTLGEVASKIDAYGNYYFYASNDVTHELKLVGSYKYKNWTFSATWIYTTGKPYTAPEGGYQLTLLDGTVVDYINVSVKNGNRFPNYHRLDLASTYNFKINGVAPCSLSFSLFNAYNRTNIWYNEYEIINNQVVEIPVSYLGIQPNISFSIKLK